MWVFFPVILIVLGVYVVLVWKFPGWLVGLLPVSVGVPLVLGLIPDIPEPFPISLGALVFIITVSLVHFKPIPFIEQEPWYKVLSGILFRIIVWCFYLIALTALFHFFGAILFIISLIFVFRYKQTRRYSLSLNVLSTITAAMRQNLPLPMALETAASNGKDPAAKIYRQTAKWLCEGQSLSEALKRAYRRCPAEIIAALAAGEAMNQLPAAAAALEQDCIAHINGFEKIRPIYPAYPLIVILVAVVIMSGLCVFILPTFAEVIRDITGGQAVLPASTQLLLNLTTSFMRPGIILLVVIGLLIVLMVGLYVYNRPRRPERPRLLSRVGDWIKWHIPGVGYFERLYSLQRTIQSVQAGLQAGYCFDAIVRQTLRLDVNVCFRKKLRRWLAEIEAGRPIADSAAACGLGRTLAWTLDEKVNKGNTPQLLKMLEEICRNRYHYRLNIVHSVIWPLVVVAMGGGVGFVMFAMFSAIVSMITYTMDYSMP